MPNAIKYSTIGDTLSLKKGNFFFGVGDVGKGPSSATTYYNGVTSMSGGYTIYYYNVNETSKTSFYVANSDLELITYTNGVSGQNYTTATQCLNWYSTQTNYVCVNKNYEGIITNGLVLNLDAGFIPSYPKNGTTWYDLSYGGNNGTLANGPTFSSLDGGSIVFDSTDDEVNTSYGPTLGDFTIGIWFKDNASPTYGRLVDKSYTGGFWLGRNGSTPNSWGGGIKETSDPYGIFLTLTDGQWNYLTSIRSGSTHILYGNGITNTTSNTVTSSSLDSTTFSIGSWSGPETSQRFKGDIGLVQVYNRALTSSEVLQNYNAGLSRFNTSNIVKDNLVLDLNASNTVSYPATGTVWRDLSGYGNVGTLINGPSFNSTSNGIVFDGADDYVSNGTTTYNITNQFTIEVLCNPTQQVNGMFNFVGPNGSDRGIMAHWPWSSDYGYFDITNTSGGFFRWYKINAGILNVTALYHFILTPNGQMMVKRNNQIMAPSGADTFTGNVSLGVSNTIGSFGPSVLPWAGNMYKFRVYNRALTDAETTQNYYGAPIITDGLVMTLDAGNIVSYPGSGTSWKDLTTNGNNSTLYNGPTFSSVNGGVISFDGADDYGLGTIPSSTFTGAHSIGCWFYRRTVTQWAGLFSNNVNTTSCSLLTFIESTNKIGINQAGVSGTDISVDLGSGHLNKWIYCVLVVSGVSNGSPVSVYAYMDGSLLTSSGNLYWNMETSSSYYVARHWTSGSQIIDGLIPQLSVYNRALTPQEISQNYNATKSRFGL